MLTIDTTRFGPLEVAEEAVLHFEEGLIGFPEMRQFAAVPHGDGAPFVWLQSVERADLAFLLLRPHVVCPGYAPPLPPDVPFDATLWAIVTVPAGRANDLTVNLLGPVAVWGNAARQLVLDGDRYSARHRAFPAAERQQPATAAAA